MKKLLCGLMTVVLICSILPASFAAIDPVPEVHAENIYMICRNTGEVVYQQNADARIHPASTTKIMTLLLALEQCKDLSVDVTVTSSFDDDLVIGSSSINLKVGETLELDDLIYAIAVASANDAANVVAEHVAGSISEFVDMMNDKAKELKMDGTHFVNTHGLTDDNHYTTAKDMGKLMEYALQNDRLRTYLSTYAHTIPATEKNEKRVVSTTNNLINSTSTGYYRYACGGKTGTTTPAGYNLVSWASYNDIDFILVAMHADKAKTSYNPIFSDSRELYKWAFTNFSKQKVIDTSDPQTELPVKLSAEKDYVVLTAAENMSAVLPNDIDLKTLTYTLDVPDEVLAPVVKGDAIGFVTVSKNGVVYGKVGLVAGEDISRSAVLYYIYCIERFFSNLWVRIIGGIIVILLIIYIILMIRRNRDRRRRTVRLKPRIKY